MTSRTRRGYGGQYGRRRGHKGDEVPVEVREEQAEGEHGPRPVTKRAARMIRPRLVSLNPVSTRTA